MFILFLLCLNYPFAGAGHWTRWTSLGSCSPTAQAWPGPSGCSLPSLVSPAQLSFLSAIKVLGVHSIPFSVTLIMTLKSPSPMAESWQDTPHPSPPPVHGRPAVVVCFSLMAWSSSPYVVSLTKVVSSYLVACHVLGFTPCSRMFPVSPPTTCQSSLVPAPSLEVLFGNPLTLDIPLLCVTCSHPLFSSLVCKL